MGSVADAMRVFLQSETATDAIQKVASKSFESHALLAYHKELEKNDWKRPPLSSPGGPPRSSLDEIVWSRIIAFRDFVNDPESTWEFIVMSFCTVAAVAYVVGPFDFLPNTQKEDFAFFGGCCKLWELWELKLKKYREKMEFGGSPPPRVVLTIFCTFCTIGVALLAYFL